MGFKALRDVVEFFQAEYDLTRKVLDQLYLLYISLGCVSLNSRAIKDFTKYKGINH